MGFYCTCQAVRMETINVNEHGISDTVRVPWREVVKGNRRVGVIYEKSILAAAATRGRSRQPCGRSGQESELPPLTHLAQHPVCLRLLLDESVPAYLIS
jgi:hypothetical protein